MAETYSPETVRRLKHELGRAAITRAMRDMEWEGSADTGYSSIWVDGDYPPVSGPTGEIELQPIGAGQRVPVRPYKVNPWEDTYKPWLDKVDQAFEYWDQLPDHGRFEQLIAPAQDAVWRLTLDTGDKSEGASDIGDTETATSIAYVDKWIQPGTPGAFDGQMVRAFDDAYGATRMRSVLAGQRELMIVLGLGLAGEKKIWENAGRDLMEVMDGAQTAFEEHGSGDVGKSLDIFLALVGLVASFASGGLATGLGVIAAAGGLVKEVLPPDNGSGVDAPLSGRHAEDVFDNMVAALDKIKKGIYDGESDLQTMLSTAAAKPGTTGPDGQPKYQSAYHINPGPGVAPEVQRAGPINIKSDLSVFKDIGYREMPQIAGEMGRSAASATSCRQPDAWNRPYVFGYGTEGPFQAWSDLHDVATSVVNSSAHEIVLAGQKLAQAAGFLHDTDGTSADALKGVDKQVNDAPLGWEITDSTPPDYVRLPNGKVIGF